MTARSSAARKPADDAAPAPAPARSKPELALVSPPAVEAPPLTGAARVKALIAEADAAAIELVTDYADSLDKLAKQAAEVAALDKNAPVGIVTAAKALSDKLQSEAAGIRRILSQKT